jgi:hypothetical protein
MNVPPLYNPTDEEPFELSTDSMDPFLKNGDFLGSKKDCSGVPS